jgi:protein-tyrosine phosphatase
MALIHAWFAVGGGALAVGPRPGRRTLPALRAATDVLTLLSEKEGAPAIKAEVENMGLRWWNLPLPNGRPFGPDNDDGIAALFVELKQRLAGGGRIYVHCAAGIHRTGMIAAALLYALGLDDSEVSAALAAMRPHTADGVGDERLAVARRFRRS